MEDLVEFLALSEIFKDVPDQDLKEISSICKIEQYTKNQQVFVEDDHGDHLYILFSGSVKITIRATWRERKEEMIQMIRPGEIFGEFSFIDGGRRSASAIAMEDVTILCLSRADFDTLSQSIPASGLCIMHNFAWILTSKLRKTTMLWRSTMQ